MKLEDHIRTVPHFPKQGIMFKDITTLLKHPEAFRFAIKEFRDRYKDSGITKVVGAESRGFIFGAVLAHELHCGFVPARKPGKLPAKTISQEYELEYGKDSLHIHVDAIEKGDKVLVVDDLIATGGTVKAVVEMVKKLGGEIIECAFLIELTFLKGRGKLGSLPVFSLITYDSEE
ncbi:MAG: adenine phosphoribosyltransferase [Candidatus Saganbacteria bacterium]|nr:adenine phosphoribosyltransferase [Candidatus Saganbacteria bacterium]